MSHKKQDPAEEFAVSLVQGMIGLIWAAFMGILVVLFKMYQTSPEMQLRQLSTPVPWGTKIEVLSCPACSEPNEMGGEVCYACGSHLHEQAPLRINPFGLDDIEVVILCGLGLVLLVVLLLAFLL